MIVVVKYTKRATRCIKYPLPLYIVNFLQWGVLFCHSLHNNQMSNICRTYLTAVAWTEKISKHFVFYKYFCLVLELLNSIFFFETGAMPVPTKLQNPTVCS